MNDPRLEDRLAKLGREPTDDAPAQARKQGIKTRLFGDPAPPSRIGRFLDLGLLGRGAMGTVRRAYDERLAREVAIKLVSDASARHHHERLLREAQALAKLSHPNVVQIYEAGERGDEIFIAMELVDGLPLDAWQRQRHSWRECLHVYLQAGRGLAAAHEAGLVHRDFKPSNCIRDTRGRVRVLDFGLARALDLHEPLDEPSPSAAASTLASPPVIDGSSTSIGISTEPSTRVPTRASTRAGPTMLEVRITATHTVMGTLAYMSPEQLGGSRADARSDQFSFCVALYEALFGALPFGSNPRLALLAMLHADRPPVPSFPPSPRVPAAVRHALRRGLSADPAARWPAMDPLLRELEGALRPARWRSPLLLGVLAASTVFVTATMVNDQDPCADTSIGVEAQWSDQRRDEVREALLGTGLPYAADTWETVERELDAHAQALERELLSTCRAALRSSSGSASSFAQQLCLERRQIGLGHVVELLGAADPALVEHAVPLVTSLPSVEACVALDDPSPPPAGPGQDEPQQLVSVVLDRARALIAAARYDEGLAVASQAARDAEALGDPVLHAEARLVEGRALMGRGRPEAARIELEAASIAALRYDSDALVVAASAKLVEVVGISLAEHDQGLMHASLAVSLAERPSVPLRTRAVAHTAHGNLSTTRGELEPAQHHYERAIELLREEHGDDHVSLVEPLDGLATVLRQRGELERALEHRRRALDLLVGAYGHQHPTTAFTKANLAAIHRDRGQLQEARRLLEEAIAVMVRTLGVDHPSLAAPHSGLATVLDEQGEHAKAEAEHREAIRVWEQTLGHHHPVVATARFNLAASLGGRGEVEAAIEELELALRILRSHPSPTPQLALRSAEVLRELGRRHRQRDDLVTAEARYREGIAELQQAGVEHEETLAGLLKGLGRIVLERGDAPQAQRLHERALAIYEQAHGPTSLQAAHAHRHLAHALFAQAQWDRAREHVDAAIEIYEHLGNVDDDPIADARALQGRIASAR
ncbi:tetratricopeptide repeat protein [Paraliomyxa miuraensis]|uniref:tetratricopeptide repeat protein n=1 Tax=Paraliomyxa miuraensis TaxID=376150 RepID=UPI0022519384|nr:tetratricopeptide repeat protein [Paraliomyxa miuraensis]MCX4242310.1 serine/threonine-protein kinase [Paraliomyxa miuraensis]